MAFNVLELFAQESLKFGLFLDIKTLIVPVKFSSEVLLTPCYLLLWSCRRFKIKLTTWDSMSWNGLHKNLGNLTFSWTLKHDSTDKAQIGKFSFEVLLTPCYLLLWSCKRYEITLPTWDSMS